MVFRKISDDSKETALRLLNRGRDSHEEICELVDFSKQTLYRARRRKLVTGSVACKAALGRGRPRSLAMADGLYLLRLARFKPTFFLDEYSRRLRLYRFLPTSLATIHRTLQRGGMSYKRIQKLASERDPMKRADFVRRIGQHPAEYIVSIDEVSKDNRTYARLWGRSSRGSRAEAHHPFVRKRRLSMVAALTIEDGIIASRVLEGSFTHKTFLEYLRDDLLPLSTPYPGPRSIIVMDNARIHHSEEIRALVHSYGCRIEYLPPYSPDLNPIELAFSVIKAQLRCQGLSFFLSQELYYEMYQVCETITPEKARGMFSKSGYST